MKQSGIPVDPALFVRIAPKKRLRAGEEEAGPMDDKIRQTRPGDEPVDGAKVTKAIKPIVLVENDSPVLSSNAESITITFFVETKPRPHRVPDLMGPRTMWRITTFVDVVISSFSELVAVV